MGSSYAYGMNGYYGIGAVNGPPGYYSLAGLGEAADIPVAPKEGMGFLSSLILLGAVGGAAYGACWWMKNKR